MSAASGPSFRPTVVVLDHPARDIDVEAEIWRAAGLEAVQASHEPESRVLDVLSQADAILTALRPITCALVEAGARLKIITRAGVGVDNIDVECATRHGVIVSNVPGYCTGEVADHAMTMLMSLARNLAAYQVSARSGVPAGAARHIVHRLAGQVLGIVGLGRIGRAVARRASAFEMDVVAYDPIAGPAASQLEIPLVDLPELLARSDFVTLHMPLTAATRGFIGRDELRHMKPSACLINTARADLVDQPALVSALREGRLAGAALDVFEPETLPVGHPLLALANVLLTPHVAYYSEESLLELRRTAATDIANVLTGRRPASVVNESVLARYGWADLA